MVTGKACSVTLNSGISSVYTSAPTKATTLTDLAGIRGLPDAY
jgi:hypothetical protein